MEIEGRDKRLGLSKSFCLSEKGHHYCIPGYHSGDTLLQIITETTPYYAYYTANPIGFI